MNCTRAKQRPHQQEENEVNAFYVSPTLRAKNVMCMRLIGTILNVWLLLVICVCVRILCWPRKLCVRVVGVRCGSVFGALQFVDFHRCQTISTKPQIFLLLFVRCREQSIIFFFRSFAFVVRKRNSNILKSADFVPMSACSTMVDLNQ